MTQLINSIQFSYHKHNSTTVLRYMMPINQKRTGVVVYVSISENIFHYKY